eukprot:4308155-Pyramimonas_sp.AAC.1
MLAELSRGIKAPAKAGYPRRAAKGGGTAALRTAAWARGSARPLTTSQTPGTGTGGARRNPKEAAW